MDVGLSIYATLWTTHIQEGKMIKCKKCKVVNYDVEDVCWNCLTPLREK